MSSVSITIILDRLRSAHNTGNIFRLADAVGAREIFCCGYTPAPPHPKLEKTAMGADKTVPCRVFPDSLAAVRAWKEENPSGTVLTVETLENAVDAWDYPYCFPLALVFGNEALGILSETLSEADGCISLPMFGIKTSINVGNCAAVVLYSVIAKTRSMMKGSL